MSFTPVSKLTRQATRSKDEPLNILTFPTHERYETGLCLTGHNFYAMRGPGIKDWDSTYAPLPDNYTLLPHKSNPPTDIDFDLVLSQNKMAHYKTAASVSAPLHIPIVNLTHVLPPTDWGAGQLQQFKNMKGHVNVFISEYNRKVWGWEEDEALVIHHGIDTEVFKPNKKEREEVALSVVNDWINRDWCCGFRLWQSVTKDMPVKVVGNTPGLSSPAKDVNELVEFYQTSQVFVNTSLVSPVPTALLEAMSCGCAVISTANCMIPEIIQNGVNGYCTNDPREMRDYLMMLLKDPAKCYSMGKAARKTIEEKFSMNTFVKKWDSLLRQTADMVYLGHPE